MKLRDDASIKRLATKMMDRSLPKSEWTHGGHFAAALWLARHRPELTAPDEIRRLISRYNESSGTRNTDSTGYHHTITLASMRTAVHHLTCAEPGAQLSTVLANLLASRFERSDWLLEHWRRETLFSPSARKIWVEPDLSPMPF